MSQRKLPLRYLCPLLVTCGLLLQHTDTLAQTPLQYLADKDHWLNSVFVKRGWAWTLGCILCAHWAAHTSRASRVRALRQCMWLLAWWFLFTQGVPTPIDMGLQVWHLAPPLMDRVFTWSGGRCSYEVFSGGSDGDASGVLSRAFHGTETPRRRARLLRRLRAWIKGASAEHGELRAAADGLACALDGECSGSGSGSGSGSAERGNGAALDNNAAIAAQAQRTHRYAAESSRACRDLGGYWSGGHDPSGHVFLLCVMLVYVQAQWWVCRHSVLARVLLCGVGVLWAVSLLVTCGAFHTPLEKAVGFVCGWGWAVRVCG